MKAITSNNTHNNFFIDSSPNSFSITKNGLVTQGKFGPVLGSSSAFFNGSGGLSLPHTSQTQTSSDFTWETWFYPTDQTVGDIALMTKGWSSGNVGGPLIYLDANFVLRFYANNINNNGSWNTFNGIMIATVSRNQWQHVAISRQGANFYIFFNGQLVNTYSRSGNIFYNTNTSPLCIGQGTNGLNSFIGYLSGTRVSNSARYISNFTPLISNTSDGNTVALLNYTNSTLLDVTSNNNIEMLGNSEVNSLKKPFGESVIMLDG
ncbi:LamG domain-containing protein, partial [Arsenicibacter rosenii]|uniref:LamG domain-containing protein n=1 Tax=Arsenicibacter rosenii TaxID=1750698 RepID=UPI0015A62F20